MTNEELKKEIYDLTLITNELTLKLADLYDAVEVKGTALLPETPSANELYIYVVEVKDGTCYFRFANTMNLTKLLDNNVMAPDVLEFLRTTGAGWYMVKFLWSSVNGRRYKKWVAAIRSTEDQIRSLCSTQKRLKDDGLLK